MLLFIFGAIFGISMFLLILIGAIELISRDKVDN